MIVHSDLNGDEVLYCDRCTGKKKISNDAWLVVKDGDVDEVLCKSCYQSSKPTLIEEES